MHPDRSPFDQSLKHTWRPSDVVPVLLGLPTCP